MGVKNTLETPTHGNDLQSFSHAPNGLGTLGSAGSAGLRGLLYTARRSQHAQHFPRHCAWQYSAKQRTKR